MTNNRCNNNNIIESIALEQTALSHILNAEGEKIQKALTLTNNVDTLLKVNCSVRETIERITELEIILLNKLRESEYCSHCPPCPPRPCPPPFPPKPPRPCCKPYITFSFCLPSIC
ncbi:MAG: hypothetical protein RR086_00800 [Clostridia bacterium]